MEIINKVICKYFLLGIIIQLCFGLNLSSQTISGTVTSDISGPIYRASVYVKETSNEVKTDINGKYSIEVDSSINIIHFYSGGHENKEVIAGNIDTIINITLEQSPIELQRLITLELFAKRRTQIVGSIAKKRRWEKQKYLRTLDSTYNRLETERLEKLYKNFNLKYTIDSINTIENLSIAENRFRTYIIDSINYPKLALDNFVEGIIYATFIINKNEQISNIKIVRSAHLLLDNEVFSLLEKMPISIQHDFVKQYRLNDREPSAKFSVGVLFLIKEL